MLQTERAPALSLRTTVCSPAAFRAGGLTISVNELESLRGGKVFLLVQFFEKILASCDSFTEYTLGHTSNACHAQEYHPGPCGTSPRSVG